MSGSESCREYLKECQSQNKQNYLSVLTNNFSTVINIVRDIIKLSLLTALIVFVFIMDS